MKIANLYKEQTILMFKECYALEKLHGTSAHIRFSLENGLTFFSGESHANFVKLFNQEELLAKFVALGIPEVTIYGEAYGGKCQGMSATYGKDLKFCAFDVKIGNSWLSVPKAEAFTHSLNIEFVYYVRIATEIFQIDSARDMNSIQACRNTGQVDKKMEGVVLRPLEEMTLNCGSRVIVKHKRDEFRETVTPRVVEDPAKLLILEEANKIAMEWCTLERLKHVLAKLPEDINVESTGKVIEAMVYDIYVEGKGEIVESLEAKKSIGKKTAGLFKQFLKQKVGI